MLEYSLMVILLFNKEGEFKVMYQFQIICTIVVFVAKICGNIGFHVIVLT